VVEDENGVRQLIAELLRDYGFTVYEANDGADALATWRAGSIDLLITDVVMPKMGGPELAGRLQNEYPELKVIYISGYSGGNFGQSVPPPGSTILVKPFDPNDLLSAVSSVLGRIE
jgi:CheY-like chemotaxis protein